MFLNLPQEVVIEVLNWLDCSSLLACRSVCCVLRGVVDEEPSLQLELELRKSGLSYAADDGLPIDVVGRLRQLRTHWKGLAWTGRYEHTVKGHCNAYELVDGLFVKTDSEGRLLVLELPTTSSPFYRVLVDEEVGFQPGDFTLDPTQDLIAFLKVEPGANLFAAPETTASLRLLSMSRLQDHPEATKTSFYFNVYTDVVLGSSLHGAITQIAGNLVGVFVCSASGARLMIWNWKNGKLVGDSSHSHLTPGAHSFTFVSPDLFYVTSVDDSGIIALYSVDSSGATTGFTHVASLVLPALQANISLHSFSCHTEQLLAKKSVRTSSTLPRKQLHSFTLTFVDESDFSQEAFLMLATASLFLDYHSLYMARGAQAPVIASWDDWGPFHTRFLSANTSYHWLRYVHGQRVVLPFEDHQLEILDFNVQSESELAAPTVLPRDRVFEDMVVSRLPYFRATKVLQEYYHGLMIDNNRLIGLSIEDTLGAAINRVTVFTF